jgi:hypothetical protein
MWAATAAVCGTLIVLFIIASVASVKLTRGGEGKVRIEVRLFGQGFIFEHTPQSRSNSDDQPKVTEQPKPKEIEQQGSKPDEVSDPSES